MNRGGESYRYINSCSVFCVWYRVRCGRILGRDFWVGGFYSSERFESRVVRGVGWRFFCVFDSRVSCRGIVFSGLGCRRFVLCDDEFYVLI